MFFPGDRLQVVGHRGYPARFPDNTMAGMALAFGVVGMVETDVRRTGDGLLALSHDPHLLDHVVCETPWEVLRTLDLGAGQRPLLLAEALAAFPDRAFNLEVKNWPGDPGFEEDGALALEVAAVSRPGDLLSSFHWATMDAVRSAHPEVATGLLLEGDVALDAAIEWAVRRGHVAIIPEWSMLSGAEGAATVNTAHEAGVGVATWTVNDAQVVLQLARIGVDAVITNDPGLMVAAIERSTQEDA